MTESISFWRRTPPALFPACLGLLGLGLAWRQAGGEEISLALVLVGLVAFVATFISYSAKVLKRPAVLGEELKVPPARAAVAASAMCWMLVAAVATPFDPILAAYIWVLALLLHIGYLAAVIVALIRAKFNATQVLPAMLLPFVGYIVAAISGPELGFISLSKALIYISLPVALLIFLLAIVNALKGRVNIPDRVTFCIFLAPISIYGLAAEGLWSDAMVSCIAWASLVTFLMLVGLVPWMVCNGWTPAWGALTFPLAAFASLMHLAAKKSIMPDWFAWGALVLATAVVLYIFVRIYHFWYVGKLAAATKAAIA